MIRAHRAELLFGGGFVEPDIPQDSCGQRGKKDAYFGVEQGFGVGFEGQSSDKYGHGEANAGQKTDAEDLGHGDTLGQITKF